VNLYNYSTGSRYGFGIDLNLRTPYVHQWNLGLQRELGRNTSMTIPCVGNKGSRLYRAIDLNQLMISQNGFVNAFNVARQNGFAALAANQGFNPRHDPSSTSCNPSIYILCSYYSVL